MAAPFMLATLSILQAGFPDFAVWLDGIEKFGIVAVLAINAVVLWKLGVVGLKQITSGEWVPGRYYKDVTAERDRLRAENDAYRSVTLRAVGVAERIIGTGV
jgi:hypothetical protein